LIISVSDRFLSALHECREQKGYQQLKKNHLITTPLANNTTCKQYHLQTTPPANNTTCKQYHLQTILFQTPPHVNITCKLHLQTTPPANNTTCK
jgi:hypothetical protein